MDKVMKVFKEHPGVETVWVDTLTGEVYFTRHSCTCKKVSRKEAEVKKIKEKSK